MRLGALLLALGLSIFVGGAGASRATPALEAHSVRLAGLPHYSVISRAAVDWCGAGQPVAAQRTPDAVIASQKQVHVTYAIPADAGDQFAALASRIATDAAAMDTWWRGQDAARTIRFDLFAFPGCATAFGKLDIGFVRLPRAGNLYVGDAGADRLVSDLGELAALTSQKHLVYYDGPPVYDTFVCGTTFVPSTAPMQGGRAGIAFVWLRSLCGGDLGASGLNAAVAVHELIHGLGALIQAGAPNECDPPNDGHVCDSTIDILYPQVTSATRIGTEALDVNRDDYYGEPSQRFDVQDSGWLTHLPSLVLTMAVQPTGTASGVIHLTTPAQVDCATTCSVELDTGTSVTLVAQPSTGARFAGWSGACSGTAACVLVLDGAKTVSARFVAAVSRFTVSISGKGRVTSSPAGITCPGRCSANFNASATVRLRATPATGQRFAGWSGSCRGTGSCTLAADRSRAARATFKKKR